MTAKAVFVSQTFNIYFSGKDLEELLDKGGASVPLYIGKRPAGEGAVQLTLVRGAYYAMRAVAANERLAIENAKQARNEALRRGPAPDDPSGGL